MKNTQDRIRSDLTQSPLVAQALKRHKRTQLVLGTLGAVIGCLLVIYATRVALG